MISGRSDIEKLFTLWLEGRIDDIQAEQLISFLESNPEMFSDESFLSLPRLRPEEMPFPGKEKLRKTLSDLSNDQMEYLSVAALENDLSDQGKKELEEMIKTDESRRKIHESILKTKLIPQSYNYPYKSRLKKLTVQQKVLRYSFAAISTAAAIALLVTVMVPALLKRSVHSDSNILNLSLADTIIIYSGSPVIKSTIIQENGFKNEMKAVRIAHVTIPSQLPAAEVRESNLSEADGSYLRRALNIESFMPEIRNLKISGLAVKYNALAGFPERLKPPVFEKNRSNVDRFVAKLIHYRILKDTLSVDRPVKGYDIAKAGVVSINKLLGWDMSLDRTSDEEGDLKSVYFSSAILKFNMPVKKSNRQE